MAEHIITNDFAAWNADCIDVLKSLDESSIGLTVSSLPYLNLYSYSDSPRDIGNSTDDAEFWEHFRFVIAGLLRVTKPGRIVAIDCMNVPSMKERDGVIGIKDFRGDIIREFREQGFVFHSEHVIWRDPLLEATRSKALGLLHRTLCKDSSMVRAGIPQYLLAFRKPGENPEPIAHPDGLTWFAGEDEPLTGNLSHERWRRYASPVWMDIRSTRTLNGREARDNEDDKHICPMALDIIERAVELWSNPGDTVFDPFGGIGSTSYISLLRNRRAAMSELKLSYYRQAVLNIEDAIRIRETPTLFADEAMA